MEATRGSRGQVLRFASNKAAAPPHSHGRVSLRRSAANGPSSATAGPIDQLASQLAGSESANKLGAVSTAGRGTHGFSAGRLNDEVQRVVDAAVYELF